MTAKRSDLDAIFEMDEAKEKDGVGINFGKLTVKIARAGGSNKTFLKVWEELTRPYKRIIEAGIELPEDVAEDLLKSAYAQCVVRDWNLAEDDGTPVPCDEKNVRAEFDRRMEFFRFVFQESQRAANYRKMTREAEAKN